MQSMKAKCNRVEVVIDRGAPLLSIERFLVLVVQLCIMLAIDGISVQWLGV